MTQVFTGAAVFDGIRLEVGARLRVEAGRIVDAEGPGDVVMLKGGILAPGLLDLQVNGGGGQMVGEATDLAAIREICAVHARLGQRASCRL